MRIASLVPSTTEILFAVGAGSDIVARSHECDHPQESASIPAVTTSRIDGELPPALLDNAGTAGPSDVHSIYDLDGEALAAASPELVVTRSQCPVCGGDTADDDVCSMPPKSRVVSSDPHSLDEILTSIIEVAAAAGRAQEGRALAARLRSRLHWVTSIVTELDAPRVAVIEWPDPLHAPGHWVPEMVEVAGGINVLGGVERSTKPITLDDLAKARPDVIVAAFRGFSLYETQAHFKQLAADPGFAHVTRSARIFAVDGSAFLGRPGPRVVEGIELLAWSLHRPHPRLRPPVGRGAKLIEAGWVDVSSLPLSVPATA